MFKIISVDGNKITVEYDYTFIEQAEFFSGMVGASAVKNYIINAIKKTINSNAPDCKNAEKCINLFCAAAYTPKHFDKNRLVAAFNGDYNSTLPLLKGMEFVVNGKDKFALIYNNVKAVREGEKFYVFPVK